MCLHTIDRIAKSIGIFRRAPGGPEAKRVFAAMMDRGKTDIAKIEAARRKSVVKGRDREPRQTRETKGAAASVETTASCGLRN